MRNQQKGDHETNEFQLAIACAALVLGCILLAPSQRWQEHNAQRTNFLGPGS